MNSFEYRMPQYINEVTALLSDNANARVVSGNTDLINEIKEGIVRPTVMVSLSKISKLSDITWSQDALVIGSMVTLKDLASNKQIRSRCPAIAQAADSVATPQIRNVGTLGGNLCQRPRCWYYRSSRFDCLKKGGDVCFAEDGLSKYHAIYGGMNCHIVHPSDLATALTSLKATIEIQGQGESREVPISEFFTGPDVNIEMENSLEPGEFITSIQIPNEHICSTSTYVKAKERSALDFALVSVAVAIKEEKNLITDAGITLGGVAPVPWRLPDLERELIGSDINSVSCDRMAQKALSDAVPMKHNRYKVPMSQTYFKRALHDILMCLSESHGSRCTL